MQVLWLADNYISRIEGISHLSKLRELNLARNDISHVANTLDANSALQQINLADNRISSFQVGAVS